jgi:hypothetical protein
MKASSGSHDEKIIDLERVYPNFDINDFEILFPL